jgi:hypothetical protein
MPYSPEEVKLLARCDNIISLEKHPGWEELRTLLSNRIRAIEDKIHLAFEKDYAPDSDHIYYLNLVKHERENFLVEVEGWFAQARNEQDRIAKENNEYNTDYAPTDR